MQGKIKIVTVGHATFLHIRFVYMLHYYGKLVRRFFDAVVTRRSRFDFSVVLAT